MELIDTHAHLNFDSFTPDLDQVINNSQEEGVSTIINVGTDLTESQNSIDLAAKYAFIQPTVGIHPTDSPTVDLDMDLTKLAELAANQAVVAIGECGLDFYRQEDERERERQLLLFAKQIDIALQTGLPLIVHSREAWPETLRSIKDKGIKKGVFHSWTYPPVITEKALTDTDFYFAFNGIVTFKNALEVADSATMIPDNRLLLETDCPFLSPEPKRGLRNEPASVKLVATKVAQLKQTTLENIAQITTSNAKKLFAI